MAKSPEPVHLPSSLALAEKWAKDTGRETQRVLSDPLPDGTRLPLLVITHGAYRVLVREQGSCIAVYVVMKLPDDVRKKLASLGTEDKERLFIALRGELSSTGRNAFGYSPEPLSSVDQLEAFSVEQTLRISENDVSTCNRFYDALQETVTTIVNATSVFQVLVSTSAQSTTAVKPASGALYG